MEIADVIISIQYTHIWACPICAHILVPFVPIMEIADVIRIQYAHIWAGHASFVAIYEVRQHSLIAKCT